jgi:hypothetical protein
VIDLIAFRYGYLLIEEIPPARIKKKIAGSGKAERDDGKCDKTTVMFAFRISV